MLKGYSSLFDRWRGEQPPLVDELDDIVAEPQLEPDPEYPIRLPLPNA